MLKAAILNSSKLDDDGVYDDDMTVIMEMSYRALRLKGTFNLVILKSCMSRLCCLFMLYVNYIFSYVVLRLFWRKTPTMKCVSCLSYFLDWPASYEEHFLLLSAQVERLETEAAQGPEEDVAVGQDELVQEGVLKPLTHDVSTRAVVARVHDRAVRVVVGSAVPLSGHLPHLCCKDKIMCVDLVLSYKYFFLCLMQNVIYTYEQ